MLPNPILFNLWKHHAGFLREQANAPQPLHELPRKLLIIGSELMDLYTGTLTPVEIANTVLAELAAQGLTNLDTYRDWLMQHSGYRVVTFAADDSSWTLRLGDENDRYVHVHPGRRTPHTVRVRANVLKTAVMVTAFVHHHGGDPMDVALVNRVRVQYLKLSPMREVLADAGLGPILRLLQTA